MAKRSQSHLTAVVVAVPLPLKLERDGRVHHFADGIGGGASNSADPAPGLPQLELQLLLLLQLHLLLDEELLVGRLRGSYRFNAYVLPSFFCRYGSAFSRL